MMNTATVGLAVTPTVISTLLAHYLKRKSRAHKPTAHLSYDEGLRLIRAFLAHSSRHTVEELQAFTSQWVPHPHWVKVDHVEIPESDLTRAAELVAEQLGPDGIRQVGGKQWWQWRGPKGPLRAEWIEMRADYEERKKNTEPSNRVMLYVHGGAYYFGSVDEHRYQIQRHARKLKARALAPRYRLAPQFPFPCGLQDCLATYLYLITHEKPSTVILAGDSAGAGMILSMMIILRDRGLPLPAGAVLISPWVDLTHSFPSVAGDCPLDYIPPAGFHHKPSRAWPPPDEEELEKLKKAAVRQKRNADAQDGGAVRNGDIPTVKDVAEKTHRLKFLIDGEQVEITEQIQMYTTNELLAHPLVSPIMQPTLGGLPPLLIMVGGGEMLRDEQIYLAHKCANPSRYLPPEALMDEHARALIDRYKPTDVQLQVWDDLCHVAPTLSFTRPAKFMYRSVAQFSAWALARAQKTEIGILDGDRISVISRSSSSSGKEQRALKVDGWSSGGQEQKTNHQTGISIGKAGDPLPPFVDHMIRQRVTRHGDIFPLPPPEELPGCSMPRELVGVVKVGTIRKWLEQKRRWDTRFKRTKARIHRKRLRETAVGYEVFGEGEVPPPSALAGRRRLGAEELEKKKAPSMGLSLWALFGSKHDKVTVQREQQAEKAPERTGASADEGHGARAFSDLERQEQATRESHVAPPRGDRSTSRAWRSMVSNDGQLEKSERAVAAVDAEADLRPAGPVDDSLGQENEQAPASKTAGFLSPDDIYHTGVSGKRVMIGGLAAPFSLRREAETASMITLASPMDQGSVRQSTADSSSFVATPSVEVSEEPHERADKSGDPDAASQIFATPSLSPASPGERPVLERFVTAQEGVVKGSTLRSQG
ncbi:hypothetical protein VTK56DRAFT_2526 [Thermocarpiscus australiensis]